MSSLKNSHKNNTEGSVFAVLPSKGPTDPHVVTTRHCSPHWDGASLLWTPHKPWDPTLQMKGLGRRREDCPKPRCSKVVTHYEAEFSAAFEGITKTK